ncbi:DUF6090 family protein [Roseivirga sp. E12]|uniref:DUF6090 family protein n=1 Tax=Roseivirga sp. E12 TaxID=2819237 RepID=UPI001ABC5AEF|nr:DUF6090 family protein [Roseivirga sp. E12]MBO3700256.1 hypothetical protein [Roseivirga sp. E12]
MLNFLRKLRKRSNKTGYFKYAIGEIFLVVIGILLALQISDWNQFKKDREFELFTLKEVENNLQEDRKQISRIVSKYATAKASIEDLSSQPFSSYDSAKMAADIDNIWGFERFFPIRNGYEALKSRGFQVSNAPLRTALGRYYENELTRVTASIFDIERAFLTEFSSIIESGYVVRIDNREVQITNQQSRRFESALKTYARGLLPNITGTVLNLNAFMDINEQTLKAINQEIERLAK